MSTHSPARRPVSGGSFSSGRGFRAVLAAMLFFALPVAADAYTLVLRSGRRVIIPDTFTVTPTAVIYESSPGFSVTVWLSNVDTAATERANAEPAGNFAGRIRRGPEGAGAARAQAPEAATTPRRAGRTVVTNKDLEPSRLRRAAQEEEYERTRRERGMPSKQELQERVEEEDRELREWARQMEAERREAELESLKSELVNVRRHLNELSLHLSQQAATYGSGYPAASDYPYFYAPPVQVITVVPFGRRGRFGRGNFGSHPHGRLSPHHPRRGHSPQIYVSPSRNTRHSPRTLPPVVHPMPRHQR